MPVTSNKAAVNGVWSPAHVTASSSLCLSSSPKVKLIILENVRPDGYGFDKLCSSLPQQTASESVSAARKPRLPLLRAAAVPASLLLEGDIVAITVKQPCRGERRSRAKRTSREHSIVF